MTRKEQILLEVIKDFDSTGFSVDFTMSELAERVDIGKSTLYEYFKNKDDIIKEALFMYMNKGIEEVNISEEIKGLPFEKAFKKQMFVLLTVADRSRSVLETFSPRFIEKLPISLKEEMRLKMEETRDLMQQRFTKFFLQGIEEGALTNVNPQKALVVSSLIIGSIMVYTDSKNKVEINDFISEIYNSIITLLN